MNYVMTLSKQCWTDFQSNVLVSLDKCNNQDLEQNSISKKFEVKDTQDMDEVEIFFSTEDEILLKHIQLLVSGFYWGWSLGFKRAIDFAIDKLE